MPKRPHRPAIVIGGGVIGIACALRLQQVGVSTLLVEAAEPGHGCSFGNAGVIANSFVLPLSSPGHILAAPKMLMDPLGPLALRGRDLPQTAGWIARFVTNALPGRRRKTIEALKSLNTLALPAWRDLLGDIGQSHVLHERGMLDIAREPSALASLRASAASLMAEGISLRELSSEEVSDVEPILAGRVAGGMLHEHVAHVESPLGLVQAMLAQFRTLGGEIEARKALALVPNDDGVRVETDRGGLDGSLAIAAAGFGSAALLRAIGMRVPIGIEHGYHLMLPHPGAMPTRPISFHSESFLATPMQDGLRLAGTVEIASPDAAPRWTRAEQLGELARRYLPSLDTTQATRWMGGRPSFPDSIPAIGRVPGAPQILYAFGHQHLGLTQAAATAACALALTQDITPPIPLDAFTLERFGAQRPR